MIPTPTSIGGEQDEDGRGRSEGRRGNRRITDQRDCARVHRIDGAAKGITDAGPLSTGAIGDVIDWRLPAQILRVSGCVTQLETSGGLFDGLFRTLVAPFHAFFVKQPTEGGRESVFFVLKSFEKRGSTWKHFGDLSTSEPGIHH